ncbi:ROK family protein [Paracoccus sulfuroxidans]|uniref:Putative NBD/HSP70 family sugar kinase n=1 Tax=Paracoccus sulfuroxidans TaxID=384678 RepID=A0A562NFQ4_9RHOB|nr:ROK family protein [Paracoccus sulfuroxidans]TWI30957.1 putative NBD/HSP70 family sugar kinase [Paracoccus sulfuroxidans]
MMSVGTEFLALDLGATKLAYCKSVTAMLPNVDRIELPRCGRADEEFAALSGRLESLPPVSGVPVICVAPSLNAAGQVLSWPNRPYWKGFPLIASLEKLLGTKVRWLGDGEAAALANAGDQRGLSYVSLQFGTGVGGAIVCNGQVLRLGPINCELGHIIVDGGGPICTCGARGCLQAVWQGYCRGEISLERLLDLLAVMIANLARIFPGSQITLGGRIFDVDGKDVDGKLVQYLARGVRASCPQEEWLPTIRTSVFGPNAPIAGALREAVRLGNEHV